MRSLLVFALVAGLGLLAGCGGGSSSPPPPPVTVSISPSTTQSISSGQTLGITASSSDPTNSGVSWSMTGVGSLTNQTATSVTYNAPTNLASNASATVTATALTSSSAQASVQINVTAIVVSLTPSVPQFLDQNQSLPITANVSNASNKSVTWSISPAGVGTLTNVTATSVTYNSPSSLASNTIVNVIATSVADTSASSPLQISLVAPGQTNVHPIVVDGGPVSTQIYPDGSFAAVTVCVPGTSQCQTIDGVLVDTGSSGLRILASQMTLPLQPLAVNGSTLNNCVLFADGSFLWGQVAAADVYLAGEVAPNVPVQVVADPTGFAIPSGCSGNGGIDEDNQAALGANGILGVGPEPTDCTLTGTNFCVGGTTPPGVYYNQCSGATGCQATFVPVAQQITNPVVLFDLINGVADNNGVIVAFPALPGAAPTLSGSMTFGIGTQSNNGLGTATVYTMDSSGNFTTNFSGQSLLASFIDSGSNGFFFPSNFNVCTDFTSFYCDTQNPSATNIGANNAQGVVNFSIGNADTLFATNDAAYGDLGGPNGTYPCSAPTCAFDWGLPFFFGRSVFTAIDGQTVLGQPATPWWAY